jgi:YbbR domain-containing protein
MNPGKMIFNNFLAKLIALVLSVSTWFYVHDLIRDDSYMQRKQSAEDVVSKYKFIVKEVPVRPIFVGKSPEGYMVDPGKILIVPDKIAVFGPRDILDNVDHLNTEKINLSEYTRSSRLRLGLKSSIKFLKIEDKVVDVYLPVVSLQEAGKEAK